MRIGIIYLGNNKKLESYKNLFVSQLTAQNHTVREITPDQRPGGMQYLVFFLDSGPIFSKKYLNELKNFFKNCGIISAHFASVFIPSRPFVNGLFLKYMQELEKQGLIIHYSDVIDNTHHAKAILDNFEPTMH